MRGQLKDYYSMLGVSRIASVEEIKNTYRQLVKQFHPDVNKTPEAEAKMKEINEAYAVLGDPEEKGRYDIVFNHYINPPVFVRYYQPSSNVVSIDGTNFTVTFTYGNF